MIGPNMWSEHPGDDDSYELWRDDDTDERPYEEYDHEDHSFGEDYREDSWPEDWEVFGED